MRPYDTRSTVMISNRPPEDGGKPIGDVSSATAMLDRFVHNAKVVTITGKSHRLRSQQEDKKSTKNSKNRDQACRTKGQ